MKIKNILRNIIDHTPFRPVHLGYYTRNLYFKKYLRRLPVHLFVKILDAGCSSGSYAVEVANAYPHMEVTAVDIKTIDFPLSFPPNLTFFEQNLMELETADAFDFIYSIDVLEHIKENRPVMENLFRALKPGGYIFLHIPNDRASKHIFPVRHFKDFDKWAKDEHVGEQYTPTELRAALEPMGFTIIASEYTFGFPGRLAWEIDRMCDSHFKMKILFMPLLKTLAHLAVFTHHKSGSTLVLAQKTVKP